MDFYQTVMGKRFFEGTVPEIARQLKRIADALEKQNDLKKTEKRNFMSVPLDH